MKTLQEQYNLLKEGKGNADVFLKSARRLFPEHVTNFATQKEAVTILKQKSIISENFIGLEPIVSHAVAKTSYETAFTNFLTEEEVKVDAKKVSKEVEEDQSKAFDYKDDKNLDNLYGEAFLQGYYTEMKAPKNADKDVTELKEIVAKNLAKDRTYYATEAQFGIKGIGYKEDLPGLGPTKEVKGKYASSGMEEVKLKEEKMIKLTDLINETLGGYTDLRPIGMQENARTDAEEEGYLDGMKDEKEDLKAKPKSKKVRKETIDTKLAEIENAGKVTTLEAQIEALDEAIDTKNERISMVSEDENLSELVDKAKMKEMQREVKDLEKRKVKMEKLYEKMCGKAYSRPEMVDEAEETEY